MGSDPNFPNPNFTNLLPGVIDQLTPQGQVTDGDALNDGIAALAKSFLR